MERITCASDAMKPVEWDTKPNTALVSNGLVRFCSRPHTGEQKKQSATILNRTIGRKIESKTFSAVVFTPFWRSHV